MSLELRNLEVKIARPKTLQEARAWNRENLSHARTSYLNRSPGSDRAHRLHQASTAVLQHWETTKRPPKGFRTGKKRPKVVKGSIFDVRLPRAGRGRKR